MKTTLQFFSIFEFVSISFVLSCYRTTTAFPCGDKTSRLSRSPLSSSQNRKGLLLVTSSVALYSKSREKFNPFGEMMSNLFDAATSSVDTGKVNDELESELQSCNVPAWEEIRGLLESKQTEEEKLFRENLKSGIGEGSPMHALRLFDESNKEEDVRITFYRDSASWCPYCQKVWMTLEEKRIPYKIGKFIA